MNDAGIDLVVKVSSFSEHWSPKVVARLNDYEIEVVKVDGQFVWHAQRHPSSWPAVRRATRRRTLPRR